MTSMISTKNTTKLALFAAACLGIAAISGPAEASSTTTIRPLMAASLDVGQTHIVTFFLPADGQCRLTLMMTARAGDQSDSNYAPIPSRLVVSVDGGAGAQFDVADGGALRLACSSQATAMTISRVDQVALIPAAR